MTGPGDYPWPLHPAAELFPLLPDDELAELAADVREHGLHEAIWLYRDPALGVTLLDGRNRWLACQIAGAECRTRYYDAADPDPIAFAASLNVNRRHLTPGQRAFLALDVEKLYAAEAKKRQGERTDLKPKNFPADLQESSRYERESVSRAAKAVGTSGKGVAQAKRVQQHAPDLAEQVKAGTLAIDRAERILRDRDAEQKRIEQARHEAAAQPAPAIADIRHGDFREVLADLHDIDAVITDPPYAREYLPLLADLAAWADKVLAPGGVLAVMLGHSWLPDAYRLLDGHRPYRWTACCLLPGQHYASMGRRVHSGWKPLLVYGGGPRFADVIRAEGTGDADRAYHKWGQDFGAFCTIIERLTARGQTVADPFTGSGTTLLAARALGRHCVGADIDPAAVATARKRLA